MKRKLFLLPLALVFALVVNTVPALPVSAASTSAVSDEFVAADFVSAQVKAKSLHHRILVSGELSETSTSWVNEDGTVTTDVSGSPVRVRDDSGLYGWRDLDYTLEFGVDGFVEPVNGLYPLKLSAGGTADQVSVSGLVSVSGSDGLQIGFGWAGPLPAPVLDGSCALYLDVLPGADIRVCLTATGFEQFFILKTKPTQAVLDALVLPMNLAKASVISDGAGGFSLKDATGAGVGTVPTPTVSDSSVLSLPDSTVLAPDLVTSDSSAGGSAGAGSAAGGAAKQVLRLNVDVNYFDNPDLVYPVVVDPAVSMGSNFDTYVSSAATTTDFSSSANLLVGTDDSGISKYRSYLNFDGSKFAGATVTDARLKLWLNTSASCTPSTLTVYAAKPAGPSTRWGSQPTVYSNYSGTLSSAAGFSASCPASIQTIDVTSPIAAEAKSNWPTAGLTLRSSETSNNGYKRFNSSEASTKRPQLTVTYNHLPVTPMPSLVGGLKVGAMVYTAQSTPTFSATATDADAQKLTYTFKYLRSSATSVWWVVACTVGPLDPGVKASCPSIPVLSDQSLYTVFVDVTDGTDTVTSATGLDFRTDLTAPTAPTFTQCAVQNNSWVASVASDAVCAISATNGTSIVYSVDGGPYVNAQGLGAGFAISNVPAFHEISAYTMGASGLVSAATVHRFAVGAGAMIAPKDNTVSSSSVIVSAFGHASSGNPSSAQILFQPDGGTFWVPAPNSPAVTVVNGVSGVYDYTLNLGSLGFASNGVAPINLKVCFTYPVTANNYCTAPSLVIYNPNSFVKGQTVTNVSGGQVNLRTGDLRVTDTDVSIDTPAGGFTVSRSLTTNVSALNDFAGAGWQTMVSGSQTGLENFDIATALTNLIIFEDHQGQALIYNATDLSAVDTQTIASGIALTSAGSGTGKTYSLTETNGWKTTWQQTSGVWGFGSVTDATGSFSYCTLFYSPNKPSLLRQAPGTVTNLCSNITAGTKELSLTYGGATTGTDYSGALKDVTFSAYNNASTTPSFSKVVAQYTYNTAGQLLSVTDPRNGFHTLYEYETYNYSGGTYSRPTVVTSSGLAPYRYFYSSNKLIRVARDNSLNPANGYSIENTFVYGSAINTTNFPPILADKTVWGQTTNPAGVTISFGPESNLQTGAPTAAVSPSTLSTNQLKQGSYTYFDSFGRQTNTADYGLNKWLYSYQNIDTNGNVVTSFDQNSIDVLLQLVVSEPNVDINSYATQYRYNEAYTLVGGTAANPFTATMPAGVQLTDVWGPLQESGNGATTQNLRPHTHNIYDQNAPNGGINTKTNAVYGLLTSTKTGLVNPATALTSGVDDVVLGETRYNYDDQVTGNAVASPTSGWELGKATKTTSFDTAGVQTGENVNVYNSYGQTLQSAGPGQTITGVNGAMATTPLAQTNVYYTVGANTRGDCGSHPEFAGLLCWSGNTAGDTSTLPSTTISAYNQYSQAVTGVEMAGTIQAKRTTTNTYLADGRLNTTSVAVTGVTGNTTVLPTATLYDTATGAKTGEQQSTSSNFETFDPWGRQVTYTNSVGDVTTTTYVPTSVPGAGQIASETTTNASGVVVVSNTNTYDGVDALGNTETRGLLTKKVVTAAGQSLTYQAAYNQTGALAKQTGPAGLSQENVYDDSGRLTGVTYNGTDTTTGSPVDQAWFSWSKTFDPYGLVATLTGPSNSFTGATITTKTFGYDGKHHLTSVETQAQGITDCSLNTYSFDQLGNKTGISKGTGVTGTCQSNGATTKNQGFNAYSQLTAAGYIYDTLGRNTTIPAANTQNSGSGNITLGYDSNDNVTNITQGANVTTYGYDPAQRNLTQTSTGSITTDHFASTSDAAVYTTQKTTAGTLQQTDVYANAIGDGLNTTISTTPAGTTSSAQIIDLLGSVVATIDTTAAGNATGPTSFQSFDEYGQPESVAQTTGAIQNFGWAGTANRQTETTGLILMGARVYNPVTGQFTSPDPIPGGNETTYTYPNDPINQYDYSGCWPWDEKSFWPGVIVDAIMQPAAAGICLGTIEFTFGLGCVAAVAGAGALHGFVVGAIDGREKKLHGLDYGREVLASTVFSAATSGLGRVAGTSTRYAILVGGKTYKFAKAIPEIVKFFYDKVTSAIFDFFKQKKKK